MPRQVSIEFAGAMYHVMARGNRRKPIVQDDQDRVTFLRTLAEACERTGFRVHAYVLMTNHYHLLVETPQANLARVAIRCIAFFGLTGDRVGWV
jgi:putative transposase